jgi:hypothetical protein
MEEFIKKLSFETQLTYEDCKGIVDFLYYKVGNIEEAKKIYEDKGFLPLIRYTEYIFLMGVNN